MSDYTTELEQQLDEQQLELATVQLQNERLNNYIEHLKEQHRYQTDTIQHLVKSLYAYQHDPERTARIIAELCKVTGIETQPWTPPAFLKAACQQVGHASKSQASQAHRTQKVPGSDGCHQSGNRSI